MSFFSPYLIQQTWALPLSFCKIILFSQHGMRFNRYKSSRRRCSVKKLFLKILFFNKVVSFLLSLLLILPATLLKKMAQVLSCECCKIFKNIFLTEHLRATASPITESSTLYCCLNYLKTVIFLTATFLSEPFSSICLYNICF